MSVFPNLTDLTQSQSKSQQVIFLDINKLIRKFVWKDKSPRRANPNWKKKNKVTGLCVPNIQTYYKAAVGTSLVAQ